MSSGVNGGYAEGGGGELGADMPVFCRPTVLIPSIMARGPAVRWINLQEKVLREDGLTFADQSLRNLLALLGPTN